MTNQNNTKVVTGVQELFGFAVHTTNSEKAFVLQNKFLTKHYVLLQRMFSGFQSLMPMFLRIKSTRLQCRKQTT